MLIYLEETNFLRLRFTIVAYRLVSSDFIRFFGNYPNRSSVIIVNLFDRERVLIIIIFFFLVVNL